MLAHGPIAEIVTSEVLSDAFGLALDVQSTSGRYTARLDALPR